jgi:uncharacterized protein YjbI with pentapeptide repeats
MTMFGRWLAASIFLGAVLPGFALAASPSVRDVMIAVAAATPDHPADLSHQDLSGLDLSDSDLQGVNFAGANFFGADLSGARLNGANLAGAKLDRTIIIRTDFSNADLTGATMLLPAATTVYGESLRTDAPRFAGANLTGAHLIGRIGNVEWQRAILVHTRFDWEQARLHALPPTVLSGGRFAGVDLSGAGLSGVELGFADMRGANLSDANLTGADLRDAKLDGANFTRANLSGADLRGASLQGAVGLDQATGFDTAITNLATR